MPVSFDAGPRKRPAIAQVSSYRPKQCRHRFWLDLVEDHSLRSEEDPFMLSLAASGIEHEQRGMEHVASDDRSMTITITERTTLRALETALTAARTHAFVVLDVDETKRGEQLAQSATHDLCARPGSVQLIWNAHLRSWRKVGGRYEWSGRSGKPDALARRSDGKGWDPLDYKVHRVLGGVTKARTWQTSALLDHTNRRDETMSGPFKQSDAMQLAHYVRMLEFHGLNPSGHGGIVGTDFGADAHVIVWIDLTANLYDRNRQSAMELYDTAYASTREVAEAASRKLNGEPVRLVTRSEWKSECKTCIWSEHCYETLVDADDTTLLPGMDVATARSLRACGIDTVAALAHCDVDTAHVLDAGVANLAQLVATARAWSGKKHDPIGLVLPDDARRVEDLLVANGICTVGTLGSLDEATAALPAVKGLVAHIDQARVVDYARRRKMTHVFRARGVDSIEVPRGRVEIHTDMEEHGIIYLWGNHVTWRGPRGKVRTSYHPFASFDGTDDDEGRVFAEYWAFLMEWQTLAQEQFGPGEFRVYHYTAAEDRCIRHLAKKHSGRPGVPTIDAVEAFLQSDAWVDLYPIAANDLLWPCEDHSLKTLAKYVRFMWRDNDPSGAASTLWYAQATNEALDDATRLGWQQRILDYNEDDVLATKALLEFIDRFGQVHDPKAKVPSVCDLDAKYRRRASRRTITLV